jgi:hypothetical protein
VFAEGAELGRAHLLYVGILGRQVVRGEPGVDRGRRTQEVDVLTAGQGDGGVREVEREVVVGAGRWWERWLGDHASHGTGCEYP